MILYDGSPAAAIRSGEWDVGGRRVSARAFAFTGEAGPPPSRFDPVGRRFVLRPREGSLLAGPSSPSAWSEPLARMPAGPVLIEGASEGERVRGSFRAAAEGAFAAGRGAYLLDPPAAGLPGLPSPGPTPPARAFVALFAWSPDSEPFAPLAQAAERGIPAGVLWPVIPGWTAGLDFLLPFLAAARRAGACFAVPVSPAGDPEFRKLAVEARSRVDPARSEAFFDTMHHTDWSSGLASDVDRAKQAVRDAGLETLPPRPAGIREPSANSGAAASLEERAAEAAGADEHRAARLLAAVRWIDACGRDLAPILREGNFARAFPFGAELAREAEEAVREAAG